MSLRQTTNKSSKIFQNSELVPARRKCVLSARLSEKLPIDKFSNVGQKIWIGFCKIYTHPNGMNVLLGLYHLPSQ